MAVSAKLQAKFGSALPSVLYPLCNYCQSSPCASQSCGKAYVQQRQRWGGGKRDWKHGVIWRAALGLGARSALCTDVCSSHKFTVVSVKSLELFLAEGEDNWSPSMRYVTGYHIFSTMSQTSETSRSYWWEIWRMHPWPIWVLTTWPGGLRSLHHKLKSKPCVNLRCTLTSTEPIVRLW